MVSSAEDGLRAAVQAIHTWKRGGQRAPHKPLLLLLALGRIQRGQDRFVPFAAVEDDLRSLLRDFGPSRQSQHPEYPFWRLRADGLWELRNAEGLRSRKSNTDPPVSVLRAAGVEGGLPSEYDALLRHKPELVTALAHTILDEHFPESLHTDLLAAAGLTLDWSTSTSRRRVRDPEFRMSVLRAYEFRCGVCGLDTHLDGQSAGLEAAHVHWHSHGGVSTVENGVALCALHHKLLDLGAMGLSEDHRVVVSSRLHGGGAVDDLVLRYHGASLRGPQAGQNAPGAANVRWHTIQVFKKPARPLAA